MKESVNLRRGVDGTPCASGPISPIMGYESDYGSGVFDAESCKNGAVLYLLESFGLSRNFGFRPAPT